MTVILVAGNGPDIKYDKCMKTHIISTLTYSNFIHLCVVHMGHFNLKELSLDRTKFFNGWRFNLFVDTN
jgi:hypothetical protein